MRLLPAVEQMAIADAIKAILQVGVGLCARVQRMHGGIKSLRSPVSGEYVQLGAQQNGSDLSIHMGKL